MDRRSFLAETGIGTLLSSAWTGHSDGSIRATDGSSEDSRSEGDRPTGFDAFVSELRAASAEIGIDVVSAASCLGYGIVLLTTRAEEPGDERFDEELAVTAEEYLAYVDGADDPLEVGLRAEVYGTIEAAERRSDRFAAYEVRTEWALEALRTGDAEGYANRIVGTVSPPVWSVDGNGAGRATVELRDHELVPVEGTDEVGVEATVENAGNGRSGDVELEVVWYDEAGEFLDSTVAGLRTLTSGETWVARAYSGFVDPGAIDDYEPILVYGDPARRTPEGLEIEESELRIGETARIHGALVNRTGAELGYVEAIGRVLDGEGRVLGDDWTNGTGVEPGGRWRFDLAYADPDRARLDGIAAYEVIPIGR